MLEGVFRGLHTRLHADQVVDVVTQALIECDEEVHGRQRRAVNAVQIRLERRRQRQGFQVRRQLLALISWRRRTGFFPRRVRGRNRKD
jgi:hypothetical protein